MIYLLDCDLNGTAPYQDRIDSGAVYRVPISHFEDFDITTRKLLKVVTEGDRVVIDTISSLMLQTITDAKIGNDEDIALWTDEVKNKYLKDPHYMTVYNLGTQFIASRLRNLQKRGVQIIATSHEADQTDEQLQIKVRAPGMNPALLDSLYRMSSDIGRLKVNNEEVRDPEDAEKILVPQYARILQIRPNDSVMAKYKVPREVSESVPNKIVVESMADWARALGGVNPAFAIVYGSPGAGKTTLALSEGL